MWSMPLWFVTLHILSYFTPGNLQLTIGSPPQRRPRINEVDSNLNYWPSRVFRRPQEFNNPPMRGSSFNNGNNPIRIPSMGPSYTYDNSDEPEVSMYDWSESLSPETYPSNGNDRILSNNNNRNPFRNTRPNNLWANERPIWDREITINNRPIRGREPEFIRNPSWQDSPLIPGEDLIQDRQTSTSRPQRNRRPVQSTTPLPPNSIILSRQVGLKSIEMCKKFCKKSIIPLSINLASRFGEANTNLDPLIVGGRESKEKEFPHMAAIGFGQSENIIWKCGGSLISEFYVLTAAHCRITKSGESADWVLLGSTKLLTRNEAINGNHQMIPVEDRIKHPDYKANMNYNDIALLRLRWSATFNDFVRPACLPALRGLKPQAAVASGWGLTNFRKQNSQSKVLLDVMLRVLDPIHCNDTLGAARQLPRGTDDKLQICAGVLEGGKDTCQGDSGGPLQIPQGDCGITVLGIVSFGSQFCGEKLSAGIYTRVESYLKWIEDIVWPPTENERIIVSRIT